MAEQPLSLTENDLRTVLKAEAAPEPNPHGHRIILTAADHRYILDAKRSPNEVQREMNTVDWQLLDEYGPGQVNGLRHPDLIDDETRGAIEAAHYLKARRPKLTREDYQMFKIQKREAAMRGQAYNNGADVQALFVGVYGVKR